MQSGRNATDPAWEPRRPSARLGCRRPRRTFGVQGSAGRTHRWRASPRGLIPAAQPRSHILEGVEGGPEALAAVRVGAQTVANHVGIVSAIDPQHDHASPHVHVLAERVPIRLPAPPLLSVVLVHCLLGEYLQCPIHHREVWVPWEAIAVLDELRRVPVVGFEVLADSAREHHCVRIDLQCPVEVVPYLPILHRRPEIHEKLGVARRAVLRDAHGGLLEPYRVDISLQVVLPDREDLRGVQVELVTSEDAEVVTLSPSLAKQRRHDVALVTPRPNYRDAVEGGGRRTPHRRRVDSGEGLVRPSLQVIRLAPFGDEPLLPCLGGHLPDSLRRVARVVLRAP
mmetsp:Transcript_8397/g.23967  ORF Transcript_8397/g.23967 Transcript_8397/m.23967 type:complete len:340 (+) Transcript_8397:303-1322(+)